MKDNVYSLLKNDKLKYMLLNWNKRGFTIQNKVQVLKELLDVSADCVYHNNGKDYSIEESKFSIFATSEKYYEIDKPNLGERTIVVFQEDLYEKKDRFQLLEDFVLKIYDAVSRDSILHSGLPYVLRDMKLSEFTKIQLEATKESMNKKR